MRFPGLLPSLYLAWHHTVWAGTAPLFEHSHRDTVTRETQLPCTLFLSLAAFSGHLTPTRYNLSSLIERLKLKEDLKAAVHILFRFYWRVSTHTVKIKSPAEPISWDQCVPILKAKRTRLCPVKIRAKTFHTSVLSTAAKNSEATERKMLPSCAQRASAAQHQFMHSNLIKDPALYYDFIARDSAAQLSSPSIATTETARTFLY